MEIPKRPLVAAHSSRKDITMRLYQTDNASVESEYIFEKQAIKNKENEWEGEVFRLIIIVAGKELTTVFK